MSLISAIAKVQGSQVCVVVTFSVFHLYDPGSISRLRTWDETCRSQSDSESFSPGTPVFLPRPPQIRLSRQDLIRRTIKHTPAFFEPVLSGEKHYNQKDIRMESVSKVSILIVLISRADQKMGIYWHASTPYSHPNK